MKLRDSKPLSPVRDAKRPTPVIEAALIDRVEKQHASRLPADQRDQFHAFVVKLVGSFIKSSSSVSSKDLHSLQEAAGSAVDKLLGVTTTLRPAAKKEAAPPPAIAPTATPAPAAAPLASKAALTLGATATKAPPPAGMQKPGANMSKAELDEVTRLALEATSRTVGVAVDKMPMPMVFASRRAQADLRAGFAAQVVDREVERARREHVERAFADASIDICARARAAEESRLAELKSRTIQNSQQVKAEFTAQRERRAQEKAARVAEEDRFLLMMKEQLLQEERDQAAAKDRERERIAASIAENGELVKLREEARKKAVEEALRLQTEAVRAVEAAEAAHRDKYAHIVAKQATLLKALEEATAEDRRKEAEHLATAMRVGEERAVATEQALAKRNAARKQALAEQTLVLRDMMAHKQSEELRRRAEDDKVRQAAQALGEDAAREKADGFTRRVAAQRAYGGELRAVMAERAHSRSPEARKARSASTAPVGFLLATKSSDADLEAAFQREITRVMGIEAKRGNDSAAVGPLLGFGAETQFALERAGAASAEADTAEVARRAAADPVATIRPARPGGAVSRGLSMGLGKRK